MAFRSVRFFNFRNIENAEIPVDAPEVFLVGENGQGKSNFMEAIYALCFGSSFRTRKDHHLVRRGEDAMALSARFVVSGAFDPALEQTVSLRLAGRRKEIEVNGKAVADRKELVRNIPCIVFCHDDIEFVRGAPEMQRWFFNQTLSLFDPDFIDLLRSYTRILRLRNAILKQMAVEGRDSHSAEVLDVYDEQIAGAGAAIQQRRIASVEGFNAMFGSMYRTISGATYTLAIRYRPSWKCELEIPAIVRSIRERRDLDFRMGTTTSGPHRDRFVFVADSPGMERQDFSQFASTGQLRLLSLILRVSQAQYYATRTGRKPVLLLDDVLLELDQDRRVRFLDALPAYDQAFFTFLPDERYTAYRKTGTMVYGVEKGRLHGIGR